MIRNWPASQKLEAADVHVWFVQFNEERRAGAAASGAIARALLGQYVQLSGDESVAFERSSAGKPALSGRAPEMPDIRFSLSHSSQYLTIALTLGRECGVDIECLERRVDVEGVAAECCSDAEQRVLSNVADPAVRRLVFLRLWTLKEAATKAVGLGLRFPFRTVDFGLSAADLQFGDAVSTRCSVGGSQLSCQSRILIERKIAFSYCVEGGEANLCMHAQLLRWDDEQIALSTEEESGPLARRA